jgi:hypothetical protein
MLFCSSVSVKSTTVFSFDNFRLTSQSMRSAAKDTAIPCPRNTTFVQLFATLNGVQSAFGTVVVIVCAVGVAGAVVALLFGRRVWEDYGRDHLLMEREPAGPASGSTAAQAERDEEIRQMLEARNARRRRRGEPELDVDAYLRPSIPGPVVDDELRAEIRDLVIARNHRRARQGKPPLDVEAEVERQISALGEL